MQAVQKTHFEQLKLVTSFDWIDFDALKNINNEILGILNDADENLIDDARKQKSISSINQRIEYIHNLAMEKLGKPMTTSTKMLKTILPRIIHHLICQCKNPNNKCERLD